MRRRDRVRPTRRRPLVRPTRRGHSGGWEVRLFGSAPAGPNIVTPTLDEVLAAIDGLPPTPSWPAVADRVVPLFLRVRPYPPEVPQPLQTVVPPGVSIGFGMDIGPALINLSAETVADWAVPLDELIARAKGNLRLRAAELGPDDVRAIDLAGVPGQILQADAGVTSALVLEPAELDRLFEAERRLFLAPMRSMLLGLPPDVDRDLAAWIFTEIAAEDPNCLAPLAYLRDRATLTVEPLGAAYGVA